MRETWIGSGINQIDRVLAFECRCGWEGELDAVSDDWQTMFFAICPNCKEELEQEAVDQYEDRDNYDY